METITIPSWIIKDNLIDEVGFCNELLNEHPLLCVNNTFFDINGIVAEEAIFHEIFRKMSPHISHNLPKLVKSLGETLKYITYQESLPINSNEIHLQNGILYTDGTFKEEKKICRHRLNVMFNPSFFNSVYCPSRFIAFLHDLLQEADIVTLQEYLGYCLIPSTKAQAMMFIIGNGGEGKSRIGVVLNEIFKDSMITGNFQRIETDKFFRYNLKNKLLMIDDDLQMSALSSTGYIKNIVTAEIPIDVEAKGKQSEQAMLYSRFLCFGNGSPKALYDKSDGFARRLLILSAKPIPKYRVTDPFFAEKLIEEKEKIFVWIFKGLQRLIANNYKFTISEQTFKNVREAVSDNCNIIDFLNDRTYIEFGKDNQVSSAVLYSGYIDWCERNLFSAMKKDSFSSWLKTNAEKYKIIFSNHVKSPSGHEVRGYKGVKLLSSVFTAN